MKSAKGFTLIELLTVIAIIGILAAMVVVNVSDSRKRARDAQRKSDLRTLQTALENYYYVYQRYLAATALSPAIINSREDNWKTNSALSIALVPAYLAALPVDPKNVSGGSGNYLGDGPTTDLLYLYYSTDSSKYLLGTNLELSATGTNCGNYTVTGGDPPLQICDL